MENKFSVLMSVYQLESPAFLTQCLESLVVQTLPPNEVLIVEDGPIGNALQGVISRFRNLLPITTVRLAVNLGLGPALRAGVEQCRFGLIARMDSDDVCAPQRFERQMQHLADHPEIDVLGASISEFDSDPGCCIADRCLPESQDAIRLLAKGRNPVNHVTVLFRKAAVLSAGNYRSFGGFEDYDLWVRMLMAGARFHNMNEPLVLVRCGNGMVARRGGLAYLRREIALFRHFHKIGFLNAAEFVRALLPRVPIRLLPVSARAQFYKAALRKSPEQAHTLSQ